MGKPTDPHHDAIRAVRRSAVIRTLLPTDAFLGAVATVRPRGKPSAVITVTFTHSTATVTHGDKAATVPLPEHDYDQTIEWRFRAREGVKALKACGIVAMLEWAGPDAPFLLEPLSPRATCPEQIHVLKPPAKKEK